MQYISQIIFLILLIVGFGFFYKNVKKLIRNIKLGKNIHRNENPTERWKLMGRIALGQGKMMTKPVAGFFHILIYVGFIIINIELLEIIIDGLFGIHRFLNTVFGNTVYNFFTAILEIFALLVIISVIIFFIRRNLIKVNRLNSIDLKGWAKQDANWILIIEFCIMFAFFKMNAADFYAQKSETTTVINTIDFPISKHIFFYFQHFSIETLHFIERTTWWFHFVAILFFLNYLYYSKHLHILLAFPNTWFANLNPKGQLTNLESVTKEVKLMLDPNANPYEAQAENTPPATFGASDVFDLNWVQLMNAYSCTECGRCTSECPANTTGKKLSPRKIMMSVRDRVEEVGKNIDKNGTFKDDNKKLLNDYISPEELWACTSCNACVEACPILIDPLSIIIDMRRYLVMEQSSAPQELNMMMTNIENNGAPWQFNQADRGNWKNE